MRVEPATHRSHPGNLGDLGDHHYPGHPGHPSGLGDLPQHGAAQYGTGFGQITADHSRAQHSTAQHSAAQAFHSAAPCILFWLCGCQGDACMHGVIWHAAGACSAWCRCGCSSCWARCFACIALLTCHCVPVGTWLPYARLCRANYCKCNYIHHCSKLKPVCHPLTLATWYACRRPQQQQYTQQQDKQTNRIGNTLALSIQTDQLSMH
jgi:hypothetical protein